MATMNCCGSDPLSDWGAFFSPSASNMPLGTCVREGNPFPQWYVDLKQLLGRDAGLGTQGHHSHPTYIPIVTPLAYLDFFLDDCHS